MDWGAVGDQPPYEADVDLTGPLADCNARLSLVRDKAARLPEPLAALLVDITEQLAATAADAPLAALRAAGVLERIAARVGREAAVARLAGVHRSLIYRHSDLHAAVLSRAAQPQEGPEKPQVSRPSLLADLANLTDRNTRLARHVNRLEHVCPKLSDRTPGAPPALVLPTTPGLSRGRSTTSNNRWPSSETGSPNVTRTSRLRGRPTGS
ncbi:hypothetical protein [Streptomyces flavotricini]|uniref:hypothetical protein n=1 Tax=Streptomyces flavotricini TaxID=66888 RepID=UPI001E5AE231|nr:hypothetical protein [Streptomyces flavotricini]